MRGQMFWSAFSSRIGLNSIQGRLTAIAFLFIVGTAVAMGVVGFHFTVNFESERFSEHFSLLADNMARNAELGVLLGNEKILKNLTENMLAVKDVQLVEIVDNTGAVIIRREREQLAPESGYVSAAVISSVMTGADNPFLEVGNGDEELGRVRIGYSFAGLEQLKKRLALGFILLSLSLAFVPVILYWRLSRAIRAPLRDVLQVALAVSRGQMDVRAEGGSLQETSTLARAFNEMLDALQLQRRKLKEANEAVARQQVLAEVGKFSMTVAHEIKNPLAIIKGSLGVLRKDEPLEPELKAQMVGFIDDEILRVNTLIEDFLLFARPRTPAFREMSLNDLVINMSERLKLMDARILVKVAVPESLMNVELNCDLALLERALFNVVRNALEAMVDMQVLVLVDCAESQLEFSVLDEGPGLSMENLDGIFEPFFSTKAKGTGLGLAIAREALNAHGGTISATNRQAGGAEFRLRLPLCVTDCQDDSGTSGGVCDLSRSAVTGIVQ